MSIPRSTRAFTLIELLTVIAIIGLLAALIISGAGYAKAFAYRSRVKAEINQLSTAIERYKKDKGYYPPDHKLVDGSIETVQTPLFYELTGNVVANQNSIFSNLVTGEFLSPGDTTTFFNTGGFLNSAPVSSDTRNYYGPVRADNHAFIMTNGHKFSVFGTRVQGPLMLQLANTPNNLGLPINPVHYNSTNPTNNPNTFDLWFDVLIQGKTNRISNWSDEPKQVY